MKSAHNGEEPKDLIYMLQEWCDENKCYPSNWMAEQAQKRPDNFKELSAQEQQWLIDKDLGILDWDGK